MQSAFTIPENNIEDNKIRFSSTQEFLDNIQFSTNIIRINSKLNTKIYNYPVVIANTLLTAICLSITEFQTPFIMNDLQSRLNVGDDQIMELFTVQFVGILLGVVCAIFNDYIGRKYGLIVSFNLIAIFGFLMVITDNFVVFASCYFLQGVACGYSFVSAMVYLMEISYNRLHTIMMYIMGMCFGMMCFIISWHLYEYDITAYIHLLLCSINGILYWLQHESLLWINAQDTPYEVCKEVNKHFSDKRMLYFKVEFSDYKIAYDTKYYKTYSFKKEFLNNNAINLIQHPELEDWGSNVFYYLYNHYKRFYNQSHYKNNIMYMMQFGIFYPILYNLLLPMLPDFYEFQLFVSKPSYNFIALNSFILLTAAMMIMYTILLPKYNIENFKIKNDAADNFNRVNVLSSIQYVSYSIGIILVCMPIFNTYFHLQMRSSADFILPGFICAMYICMLVSKIFFISLLYDNTFSKYRAHDFGMIVFLQLKIIKMLHLIVFLFYDQSKIGVLVFILVIASPVLWFSYAFRKNYDKRVIENN